MRHTCHALGCKNVCPPAHLMCRSCWLRVPAHIQREVYDTVGKRSKNVNSSWAPWWRAQARAIAHVAFLREPNEFQRDRYLQKELAFADSLEAR